MKTTILYSEMGLFPAYGRDSLPNDAPVAVFIDPSKQYTDGDVQAITGVAQRRLMEEASKPPYGVGGYALTGTRDLAVIAKPKDPTMKAVLEGNLRWVRDAFAAAGIPLGRWLLTEDPFQEVGNLATDHFIRPGIFDTFLAGVIGDEQAQHHRELVRRIYDKRVFMQMSQPWASSFTPTQWSLNTLADLEIVIRDQAPPWVIKTCYGGGGKVMAIAKTASDLRAAYEDATREWGTVFAEQYLPAAEDWMVYFLIDPSLNGPRFLLAGKMVISDGKLFQGNEWSLEAERALGGLSLPTTMAQGWLAQAKELGVSAFHLGTDWRVSADHQSWVCNEGQARLCGGSWMTAIRHRAPFPVVKAKSLVLPRPALRLHDCGLGDLLATQQNQQGILVYTFAEVEGHSKMGVVILNDMDGHVENELRRRV